MRRMFKHPLKLLLLALTAYCYGMSGRDAALVMALIAVTVWVGLWFARRLWSRRRRRTPRSLVTRVSGFSPWGRRDRDISGSFTRLAPAWQHWLESQNGKAPSEKLTPR